MHLPSPLPFKKNSKAQHLIFTKYTLTFFLAYAFRIVYFEINIKSYCTNERLQIDTTGYINRKFQEHWAMLCSRFVWGRHVCGGECECGVCMGLEVKAVRLPQWISNLLLLRPLTEPLTEPWAHSFGLDRLMSNLQGSPVSAFPVLESQMCAPHLNSSFAQQALLTYLPVPRFTR